MENWKDKNLTGVLGGMAALLGMFLPYVGGQSFFQTLSSPKYGLIAPCMVLSIALATILYALGLKEVPCGLGLGILEVCLAFPGYACFTLGFTSVLPQLRVGAWVLLGGLLVMALYPLFSHEGKAYFDP